MIELPSRTIFYTIEKAIKEYRRFAQRNLNKTIDKITIDQALLLINKNKHPELSQKELGELMFKDNASVTRMIELMTKRDYLERYVNKKDRRKYNLNITVKGEKILTDLNKIILTNRESALIGITEKEIAQLKNTLNKIINNCHTK
ncbi:MAG: DNA-binding MarR family transcriptional regulator [Polaribacter sp.]|jgi:DNA-binding MarR family transcriptional regulator